MFGKAKIKATCLGDSLHPILHYASIDLNSLTSIENFELQEEAYALLLRSIGEKKRYHSFEMVCVTWLALIGIASSSSQHTLNGRGDKLRLGLRSYLGEAADETTRRGMPRGLYALLEQYLSH